MLAKYKIKLETGGEEFTSTGDTVLEALHALGMDYTQVKTKGTITLEKGKKKSSKMYYMRPLRRIVVNKLSRVQVAKDLEFLLKENEWYLQLRGGGGNRV